MSEMYWLSDEAWAAIEPHLPYGRPGAPRVDDRRVISGILHVLKSGCRWRDCPADYGPRTTIYNRYNRWARQGIWRRLFERLAATGGIPDELAIDSTHIKAHRSASGAKGGSGAGGRPVARRAHKQDPRAGRCLWPAGGLCADARQYRRHHRGPGSARRCCAAPARLLADKAYEPMPSGIC